MHDDPKGERIAGLWHWGFAFMYLVAMVWHGKSAVEHWSRIKE